ncbi:MAG: hypothetical protein KGJ90_07270, partial [Patescibacteria group bacterium]|nr:hypothetical protein [Patescibacteria group bacterium]
AKMAIDQVMASFRTPEQQSAITAATEEKAKNIQESAQDVINVDAASKDVLPYFDTLENLNNDPSMPHVLPEQQAEASNYLQGLKMSNGHVANLMGLWDKTNSTNLVGGIENFMAAAKGTRMDMPIAKQIFESKGIGLSGSRGGVQERISQGRNEVYNAIITAHNRALTSNDPNAPQQPLLPLSFKGRAFLMKDVQNTAQKMGVPLDKAIAQIQASGNVVIK